MTKEQRELETPTLFLRRIYESVKGTFGIITHPGGPLVYTIEKPWRNNENNISCIPIGKYLMAPEEHRDLGLVWRLQGVPGRNGILIHSANYEFELKGCIAPGLSLMHDGKGQAMGVSDSKRAIKFLRALFGQRKLWLDVDPIPATVQQSL